jgi:FkbM family methyltransferase
MVFPEQGIPARVYPNIELLLHPRDWIEYLLLSGKRYEPRTLDFISANLKRGDVAVLAGVNFGLHTAVAARAVDTTGLVIGVEPQPGALLRAAENLRRNGLLQQVKLVNVALGAQDEFMHMAWASPGNSGAASLFDDGEGLMVCLVPLSRILTQLSPRKPRLLLLDVQGYEYSILKMIGNQHLPEILIVELDQDFLAKAHVTVQQLFEAITDLGYALYSLNGEAITPASCTIPERNVIGVLPGYAVFWPVGATDNRSNTA